MQTNAMKHAEAYYTLVGKKDREGVKKYLHPHVAFYGPLATLQGKDAVLTATCNFMKTITSLKIRHVFGENEMAMVVYDTDILGIQNGFPGASLLQFIGDEIVRIELFYDASRFVEKKEEIFSTGSNKASPIPKSG